MADGSIIIDTRIDTGGVSKGMNAVRENHQKSRDGCYQGICGICQNAGKHSRRSLLQQLYQTGI